MDILLSNLECKLCLINDCVGFPHRTYYNIFLKVWVKFSTESKHFLKCFKSWFTCQDLVCIKFSTCFSVKWWNSVWKEIINGSYSITFTFHLSLMANKIHHFFLIIFNNTLNRTAKVRVVFNNIVIVNIWPYIVEEQEQFSFSRMEVMSVFQLVRLWFISFYR